MAVVAAPGAFASLGMFVSEHFLDHALCASLRDEMAAAPKEQAGIYDTADRVDVTRRRAMQSLVSAATRSLVGERLKAMMPSVASRFGVTLQRCETPQFLMYQTGDFFKPHVDSVDHALPYMRDRLVSVVVFLNAQSDRPTGEDFSGGSLTFYDVIPEEPFKACALPLDAEEGLLIAFRADVRHAVTPITHGRRFTIVTWFG